MNVLSILELRECARRATVVGSATHYPLLQTCSHVSPSRRESSQAANMAARNWRLIDIDQYEEGALTLEELVDPDPRSPQEAASQAKSKSSEVRTLMQKCVGDRNS